MFDFPFYTHDYAIQLSYKRKITLDMQPLHKSTALQNHPNQSIIIIIWRSFITVYVYNIYIAEKLNTAVLDFSDVVQVYIRADYILHF